MHLYHKILGSSDTHIILLHGLLGSSDNWMNVGRHVSDYYTVHLLDMRNHGRSPHSQDINYAIMAEDVAMYIKDNHIVRPIVIGHSMGGKVAMYLALYYSDSAERIIVIDIAPKSYSGGHEYIINAMLEAPLSQFSTRHEADTWLSERIKGIGIRQFIMKNLARDSNNRFRWACNLHAIAQHYPSLMQFDASGESIIFVDFIKGQLSDYIMPEDEGIIQSYFPHHKIHTVVDAGHWVHVDNPEGFMDILSRLLSYH